MMTRRPRPPGPHDWYRPRQFAYPICRICGIVRRRDGKNAPCKGPTQESHGRVMNEQIPSIGRIVHYRLSADDAAQINRRRTTGASIAARMKLELDRLNHEREEGVQAFAWPAGAQAHIGNEAREGDVYPMLIVDVWGIDPSSSVNGQVFLDGNDVLWATSRSIGDQPGTWSWPARV